MKKINEELNRPMSEFNDMTPKDALEEVKSLVQTFAEEFDYDFDERVSDAIKRLSVLVDDVQKFEKVIDILKDKFSLSVNYEELHFDFGDYEEREISETYTELYHPLTQEEYELLRKMLSNEHDTTTIIDKCPARQMAAGLLADDDSLSPDDYYKVEDYFTSILNGNEAEMPNINYLKCAAKQKVNLTLEELTDKYKIAGEIVRDCKNEFVDAVVEEIEETYLKNDCFPTKDCITKLVLSFLAYQEYLDKCLYKNKKPYTYEMFMSQIFKHNRICQEYGLSKFKN